MSSKARQFSHCPESCGTGPPSLAILNGCHRGAWERVGGIPLTARALYHMKELGIKRVVVLSGPAAVPVKLDKWRGELELELVRLEGDMLAMIIPLATVGDHFLYIDTAHLIDPRLLQSLAGAAESTVAYLDPTDKEKQVIRAGLLKVEDFHLWAKQGSGSLIDQSNALFPDDIDPFRPEIRGAMRPYFLEVRTRGEARHATRVLIRSQQNQVMDLPAQFIDPLFENALTLVLCHTPVTPNMVTLAGVVVASVVAWLFWHGHFVAGALCTYVVEVLDGVDGKLARTKLHYTRLGQREDVIDYVYENTWYVALAVGLSAAAPGKLPAMLAGLLIFSDTADNVFYTLAGKWYGKSIDLFSPFDAAFRRIAGRRNIYCFIFIIGFLLGYPLYTFAAVAVWAAVTASIHGVRLIQFGKTMKEKPGQRAKGT